jgi:hypothetical protein
MAQRPEYRQMLLRLLPICLVLLPIGLPSTGFARPIAPSQVTPPSLRPETPPAELMLRETDRPRPRRMPRSCRSGEPFQHCRHKQRR